MSPRDSQESECKVDIIVLEVQFRGQFYDHVTRVHMPKYVSGGFNLVVTTEDGVQYTCQRGDKVILSDRTYIVRPGGEVICYYSE